MISTAEALEKLFELVVITEAERVSISEAANRVLARKVVAERDQPPFPASAMDGYAFAEEPSQGTDYEIVGEAAAGHAFEGNLNPGQAVRIFTGAPVPAGTKRVVIQEEVTVSGETIRVNDILDAGTHIRPAGSDFKYGFTLEPPAHLEPSTLALLAAMNEGAPYVRQKPKVALIATGDELIQPGEAPRTDQITASNTFGLKAMLENAGAMVRLLPIAKDTTDSLSSVLEMAKGNDLIVTIGGASVGDHDLVAATAASAGLERAFYKVAMRPGKPLMAGRLGDAALVGLPGNPVSAMVCGEIFLRPMIEAYLGFPKLARTRLSAELKEDIPANGPREHYMRASYDQKTQQIKAFGKQDSSLLSVLHGANALLIRPPSDPAQFAGATVEFIHL